MRARESSFWATPKVDRVAIASPAPSVCADVDLDSAWDVMARELKVQPRHGMCARPLVRLGVMTPGGSRMR